MMKLESKTAISALPDDAPATAVIAAWAGKRVHQDHGMCPKGHEPTVNCGKWIANTGIVLLDPAKYPQGERTLRRWLLDGTGIVHYFPPTGRQYSVAINFLNIRTLGHGGKGDTPEAAFQQAVEQFARALREDAK